MPGTTPGAGPSQVAIVALVLLPGAVPAFKTEIELARDSVDAVAPILTAMGG